MNTEKFLNLIVFISFLFLGIACSSVDSSIALPPECNVPADQASLFNGRWKNKPIPLAVESVDFSSSELAMIENAILTWNSFSDTDLEFTFFSNQGSPYQVVNSTGSRVNQTNVCSHLITTETGFSDAIRIYKNENSWNYGSSVVALTSYCPSTALDPYFHEFKGAVMEINYVDYFSPGNPNPDLQTIVLHELGHILGLGHSCTGSACNSVPESYEEAIMYPVFMNSGNTGYAKRELKSNDKIRASCLY